MGTSNRVSAEWLFERGFDDRIVIIDCRFDLANPAAGLTYYYEDHIPGAVYLDLDRHLSAPKEEHGGRHPLPDVDTLCEVFGQAGIDRSKIVIAYDDQGGAMASRCWWLLKYLGHDQVYVLDGGYAAWKAGGYPVMDDVTAVIDGTVYRAKPRPEMLADMQYVAGRIGQSGVVIIDAREPKRYLGEEEPIDKKAGHIPGAVNYFWKDSLTPDGRWKSVQEQSERFAALKDAEEIIVYCGSGVTACPNVLALEEAGFTNVKLYTGSWSDWISYEENPIATGEE